VRQVVVVESPAKSRTIQKYLGPSYVVMASYGHVRDLVPKEGAVEPERGFLMHYAPIERNARHIDAIARVLDGADALLLATDPDREGEAISWHLCRLLEERGVLAGKNVGRIVFHEITEHAVREALKAPRAVSNELVNAQQARRALDYLVGFNLSPLLWRKIRRGLSAGRVQSAALRLIVEREEEIEKFVRREYWTLVAVLVKDGLEFRARLTHVDGQRLGAHQIANATEAERIRVRLLEAAREGTLRVDARDAGERRRQPSPPFTTSTLQQDASRRLGLSARKTMQLAQKLYEGIDLGAGSVGLITYMRTDSVQLAEQALSDLRATIRRHYGAQALPEEPRRYRTKSKNAQEAHEAIRPTDPSRHPDTLRAHLAEDLWRLYDLIWRRAVASQMTPAVYDIVGVDLVASEVGRFRVNGSVLRNPGFTIAYGDAREDGEETAERVALPPLEVGEAIPVKDFLTLQHFTEPPPRYSEATLVKTLEEYGIGRPSTYATIIETLRHREYTTMVQKRFRPTDVGRVVVRFLTEHFGRYVDYGFTARMEDELDEIARGEKPWVPVLEAFWIPFHEDLERVARTVTRAQAVPSRLLGTDPATGQPVSVRLGPYGPFVQLGEKTETSKPRYARIPPGFSLETLTLEQALALLALPRTLGTDPEGVEMTAGIGRFGPYIRRGDRYVTLREHDPLHITLEEALAVLRADEEARARRIIVSYPEQGVSVLRGRFGPYVTDGEQRARVPPDRAPEELTAEDCARLLEAAPVRRAARGRTTPRATTGGARRFGARPNAGGKDTAASSSSRGKAPGKAPTRRSARSLPSVESEASTVVKPSPTKKQPPKPRTRKPKGTRPTNRSRSS
jgi:DNA topoisomerase-1